MSARTGKFKPLPLPSTGIETESFILTPDGPGESAVDQAAQYGFEDQAKGQI